VLSNKHNNLIDISLFMIFFKKTSLINIIISMYFFNFVILIRINLYEYATEAEGIIANKEA
jgi:hypothetical protein